MPESSTHCGNDSCCGTDQPTKNQFPEQSAMFLYWKPVFSLVLLSSGLLLDHIIQNSWFIDPLRLIWYVIAYLPVGLPVLKQAIIHLRKGEFFTEFFLMGIATLGAFFIGEYPEGVGVMLFYAIGEAFQGRAVKKARSNIKALLDIRPETAHVKRNGTSSTVHPKTVEIGELIRVKPGERVPLDGTLLADRCAFDTSALTGESRPRHFEQGEHIPAGLITLNRVIELKVTKSYDNSSISRILELVQQAASRKAKTELFMREFAKVYTPAVVLLATLLVVLPALFVSPYIFEEWLYRGLVFLVISCPCALVISIPLGYFGGIGAASRNGILVKGSNFLDALQAVETVVFDKTGTLTRGVFEVQEVHLSPQGDEDNILPLVLAAEKESTHPVARAITRHFNGRYSSLPEATQQREIPGKGIISTILGKQVLVGNRALLENEGVYLNGVHSDGSGTQVHIAVDHQYRGSIVISDVVKKDAKQAVNSLKKLGIKRTAMLSGDSQTVAEQVAKLLNIDHVYAELLPEEKTNTFEELKRTYPGIIAYAGDGINDAPVLALSDVGIAMGAMGSDAAVETADVVIQSDQPSKIAAAIQIARSTRNIVWQNIALALGVKLLVMGLGAFGLASLWEAVFADVGVALLAILNAVRIQNMDFG